MALGLALKAAVAGGRRPIVDNARLAKTLEQRLDVWRELVRRNNVGITEVATFSYVIEHGTRYEWADDQALSSIDERFTIPKRCFENASRLAESDADLTYVEGLAWTTAGWPTQHAWVQTTDGVVIDPTWQTRGKAYIGIPISDPGPIQADCGTYDVLDWIAHQRIDPSTLA